MLKPTSVIYVQLDEKITKNNISVGKQVFPILHIGWNI